ncbi:MAG: hypothetical protein C0597_16525 [Marinilabiliales bacterium]|nr:MAG: hypothetical protein C0597_16525 [Marinilabiliales bacterium]
MGNKIAFLFPAFITDFTEKEVEFLQKNSIDINQYLSRISNTLSIEFPGFFYDNKYFREELNSQILAYAISCAMSDALFSKGLFPNLIAGYSMGIYASLYASGSVNFETGAELIYKAYNLVKELTETGKYGMGAIIGLAYNDIERLTQAKSYHAEIINVNNEHSMVIAGTKKDVRELLEKSTDEGALTTAELTVNTPYHSKFLLKYSEPFRKYLNKIQIKNAEIPIISTYNQREVVQLEEIKSELVFNLTQKINWYNTMQKLINLGINEMFECGAGKDLKKISRFIKGDYKLKSIHKI